MPERCEFRNSHLRRGREDDAAFVRHLDECAECREQHSADGAIRDLFRGMARPAPSLHFDRNLNAALAEERRRRRVLQRSARLMQAYWVAACLASLLILSLLPWSESPTGARVLLLVFVLLALLPVVLARVDLFDFILGTSRRLRGNS